MASQRLALTLATAAALGVGGVAGAVAGAPTLTATGPVSVSGTPAHGVFTIAGRTVRQVRYDDRGALEYRFQLTNEGLLPVAVTGLAPEQDDPRLFDLAGISPGTLGPGERGEFLLTLDMNGCESLSARAGSFVSVVAVTTERAGVLDDTVVVDLPEEIHTGSPREASCPRATATSRPRG